jgi:hypothetical protein
MDRSGDFTSGNEEDIRDLYEGNVEVSDIELDVAFNGPYGIVDPRFIGHNYVSYMFINSGENLNEGFDTASDAFRDREEGQALMLGSALGEYDFIHRRVDGSQYFHADFTVHAIDNQEDFKFVEQVETYPVFSVGRWHGQNVRPKNITLRHETDEIQHYKLNPVQAEFLYEMIVHPEQDADLLEENIRSRIANDSEVSVCTSDLMDEHINTSADNQGIMDALRGDYYLGQSITVDVPGLVAPNLTHVLVGLSVEESVDIEDEDEIDLPNEKVIMNIRDEFDNRWRMPYIVSGVGKGWGDILVEMHINDIKDMNDYANRIRSVAGVGNTKTFVITENSLNSPFVPATPEQILNREGPVENNDS